MQCVSIEQLKEQLIGIPNLEGMRLAVGVALFRDKVLSISAAATVTGKPLGEMLTLVSQMGIPVVDYSEEEAEAEAYFAENWISERQLRR
ncbi:UPF0175 family protein [Thiothrix lacustris]|uniref:UPF0175 family protein n=1 Tax=Thiothrix lacustris TaxID=525917 RepID=UPI00048D5D44|nr:UPF0175 family protein [Thiothrix lacustris]